MSTTASTNPNDHYWTIGGIGNTPTQQMTSTGTIAGGWWPPSLAQAAQKAAPPLPWLLVTDMALNESGIVLDAGFQKILVSKEHLKRLLTLIHMAELCELVGVDDDVSK